ncbi:MAG: hypothetical protein A2Y12_09305 [Planctomycetes bacterium GWF2_42_9]|nr:MAG: hypothetical protein A2Y12_09305 [Planctomycetes bacterium GWF2_42_9]
MEIIREGVVFASVPGTDKQSCAFPGCCVLPNGRWIVSFRVASKKDNVSDQRVMFSYSDDQGKNWSEPYMPFQRRPVDGKDGCFRAAYLSSFGGKRVSAAIFWIDATDLARPFFNEKNGGLIDTRLFISWSEDCGETWSDPSIVDTMPYNVPTPVTGYCLNMPNGEIACQFETYNEYDATCPWKFRSVMMFSSDGGRTWPRHVVVLPAERIYGWDQRISLLKDGSLIDMFWTYDNVTSTYLNIHSCKSVDGGYTWSKLWDTGIPGQPGLALSTLDGRLVVPYVDRTNSPAIRMRESQDDGRTWSKISEITLYDPSIECQTLVKKQMNDVWIELEKYSVGLPAPAILPDGKMLIVYYAGVDKDRTDIRWVLVRP